MRSVTFVSVAHVTELHTTMIRSTLRRLGNHPLTFLLASIAISAVIFGCYHATDGITSSADTTKLPIDTTHHVTGGNIADSTAYSFAVMGCNRINKSDLNLTTDPSTANIAQLDRTLDDVMRITPKPDYLILLGDLILGKLTDTAQLGTELRAWRVHYESLPIASSGIKLLVVAGNHEFNDGSGSALCEQSWLSIMAPYIIGTNGPSMGGADSLVSDQSRLTYSFNFKDAHFVLMNSDPYDRSSTVPTSWVAQDLATAHIAGAKHIFLFAHKPAYAYDNSISDGLAQTNRDQLWTAMEANHAEAMFAAHNHIYKRLQPHPHGSYMIIAGNGGSELEHPVGADNNFGFTLVSILKNGHVISRAFGREYGPLYTSPTSAATYPTTVRDSMNITWGE